MGFAPLQHLRNRRSTSRGPETCPLRSASRVWSPSWRFAPSETSPALFHAGSARGVHPSERSPPARYPDVTIGVHPPAVFPGVLPADEATDRTAGPRLLGFDPRGSPLRPGEGLDRRPPVAPLGFVPSRASRRKTSPATLAAGSSPVLGLPCPERTRPPAPQSLDQPPPGLPDRRGTRQPEKTTLVGFLRVTGPHVRAAAASGL